ncbi:MAG TPA: sigma-70 family RNA polymerase sigma factor, partial [Polyangiaceae bacterium]|nr:sigma-70 family RNA polymerase sigma factor [Polyangiaceae bacterium]
MPDADLTPALVVRAQRGEPAAFEALVRQHLRPAYAVALAIVARPADAEDVAQEALIVACDRIDTCREPDKFRGWMFQIVRNHAKNWLARRKLREVAPAGAALDPVALGPAPDGGAFRAQLLA